MPDELMLQAGVVEAIILANAGCRLPTSQPALDDYDAALVDAHQRNGNPAQDPEEMNILFPDASPANDGYPGKPVQINPAHQATGVSTTVTLT